ncbi:hypothetical protein BSL78_14725 [Apostichopus japonicus]|uniref:Uncharacterized protein n=1 Tax=Stichopus japonicus TaxID=307972 RepID=A0A2G8KK64_STIJA|nr:hypothetical protein BSL78_14725 [Apostichopus japonicus]
MYQGGQQNYPPPAAGSTRCGGIRRRSYPQGGGGYLKVVATLGDVPQGGNPPQPAASGYPQSQPQPGAGYPGGMPASGERGPEEPSYKGDVPDEDVEADPNNAQSNEPQPTAPPASAFDAISGYNQMDAALPPPSYQDALSSQGPPQRQDLPPAPSVNDEQAKEALLQFVSEKCCYGTGAARNMKINDIVQSSAFHYKLETFTEKRLTKHAFEPYRGQVIDSAANGLLQVPGILQLTTDAISTGHVMTAVVQGSVDVMFALEEDGCNFCHGTGRVQDFGHHHNTHHDHHHGRHGGHHGGHHHHHHGPTIDHAPPVWDSDATGIRPGLTSLSLHSGLVLNLYLQVLRPGFIVSLHSGLVLNLYLQVLRPGLTLSLHSGLVLNLYLQVLRPGLTSLSLHSGLVLNLYLQVLRPGLHCPYTVVLFLICTYRYCILRPGLMSLSLHSGLVLNLYLQVLRPGLTVSLHSGLVLNLYLQVLRPGLSLSLHSGLVLNLYLQVLSLVYIVLTSGLVLNLYLQVLRPGLSLSLHSGLVLNLYLQVLRPGLTVSLHSGLVLNLYLQVLRPGLSLSLHSGLVLNLYLQVLRPGLSLSLHSGIKPGLSLSLTSGLVLNLYLQVLRPGLSLSLPVVLFSICTYRCFSCNGHGQNRCTTCQGTSNLKTYIKLIITWTNNVNDSIVERTGLPDELIRGVSGQVAFKEELPLVWPVGHFQDQAINNASRELVERHKNSFPLERILMQVNE